MNVAATASARSLIGQGAVAAGSCSRSSGPASTTRLMGTPLYVASTVAWVAAPACRARLLTASALVRPILSSRYASTPSVRVTSLTPIVMREPDLEGVDGVEAGAASAGGGLNHQFGRPCWSVSSSTSG